MFCIVLFRTHFHYPDFIIITVFLARFKHLHLVGLSLRKSHGMVDKWRIVERRGEECVGTIWCTRVRGLWVVGFDFIVCGRWCCKFDIVCCCGRRSTRKDFPEWGIWV